MIRSYLFAALPAALLFFACGSDGDGASPAVTPSADAGGASSSSSGATSSSGGTQTSGGTDCATLAKARCGYGARCLGGLLEPTSCESATTLLCEHQRKLPGYAAALVPSSCVQGFETAACLGGQVPAELAKDECLVKGTLDVGAACEADGQCKTGSCYKAPSDPCGSCKELAGDGADCSAAACAPGLGCVSTKVQGERRCQKADVLGAPCGLGSCLFPNRCVGGTCTAPLADGASCTKTANEDDPCEHSCITGTCGPSQTRWVKPGEKCGGTGFCPAGAACKGPPGSDEKICHLDAVVGAACDDELGPECQQHLACVNGKCEERPLDACK